MKRFAIILSASSALAADPAGNAFFEQKVRPVLIEHCYSCHSAEAKKLKGSLFLDSKAGWQKGGDSGNRPLAGAGSRVRMQINAARQVEDALDRRGDGSDEFDDRHRDILASRTGRGQPQVLRTSPVRGWQLFGKQP